jgi:hypothetical protein
VLVFRNIEADLRRRVSEHFEAWEFRCRCLSCHLTLIDEDMLAMLQAVRGAMKTPLSLSSAYRCPEHNRSLANANPYSWHQVGKAVDIMLPQLTVEREKLIRLVTTVFTHHYLGETFIHAQSEKRRED